MIDANVELKWTLFLNKKGLYSYKFGQNLQTEVTAESVCR